MYNKNNTVTKKIYIKNMLGKCCLRAVKRDFEDAGIKVSKIKDNFAEIQFDPDKISMKTVSDILSVSGLSLIKTREEKIIEELKKAVHELIHEMNNVDSIAKKSDYIVGKLGLNYRYLSKIFSNHEPVTLEKYIIKEKIKKIKQLITEDEFTLSEIAYMMDYSSVQYLSAQFKKETGLTVTEYKEKHDLRM